MFQPEAKETIKMIMLGDTSVGKSTLLIRYIENNFANIPSTVGIDFRSKRV